MYRTIKEITQTTHIHITIYAHGYVSLCFLIILLFCNYMLAQLYLLPRKQLFYLRNDTDSPIISTNSCYVSW